MIDPTTSDNCPGETFTNDAPAEFPVGTTTVTWTVTDAAGNTATCTQDVVITDDELPTITCPPNQTVGTDFGLCSSSSVILGTALVADNCGVASITNNAPATFSIGSTTVTWTVTDDSGNVQTCDQIIILEDIEAPAVTCPASIMVNTDASMCTASGVSLGLVTFTDNCGMAGVTSTNDAPAVFPIGNTTVLWSTTDAAGNTAECTQVVTVVDNEDPTITCPTAITIECTESTDPSNTGTATAMDNCGVNEITFADNIITSSCPSNFTIERTWTVIDDAGLMTTCVQTITVEDTTDPTASNPAPITVQCFSEIPMPDVAVVTDEADNCMGTPTVTFVSCLLYTSPSPRDRTRSRMPSSA